MTAGARADAEVEEEVFGFLKELARLAGAGRHDEREAAGVVPGLVEGFGGGDGGLAPLAETVEEATARAVLEQLLLLGVRGEAEPVGGKPGYKRSSSTVIQRRDPSTLALQSQFVVNDHIGCIAASGDRLFGGNWDSVDLYEWSKDGRLLRKRATGTGNHYQDLKFIGGTLVGGGGVSRGQGAIDWLDPETLRVLRRVDVGTTDRGVVFTNEGITIRGGRLYLLPEDDPSRLFVAKTP